LNPNLKRLGFFVYWCDAVGQSPQVVAFLRNTSVSELAKQTRCENNGFFVFVQNWKFVVHHSRFRNVENVEQMINEQRMLKFYKSLQLESYRSQRR